MKPTFETLDDIKNELKLIGEKEETNLYRLIRKAREHGVSDKTINEMLDEAHHLSRIVSAYPERLLEWDYRYKTKYAFR